MQAGDGIPERQRSISYSRHERQCAYRLTHIYKIQRKVRNTINSAHRLLNDCMILNDSYSGK